MKRLFLSFILFCLYVSANAQANVTSTAISVQGIARNSSNNAVANSSVAITAELYYLNTSNVATTLLSRSGTVNTDAFGVFAYVVDITSSDFTKISNTEAWIKISSGGVVFAQEKLMTVPYAIHAQNGVPTGSIIPFVGSTAPVGWLICNGDAIPSGIEYDALKKVLGSGNTPATNVPDLRAMFLRGTGTNAASGYTSYSGPDLMAKQVEATKAHEHAQQGTITTTENGSHSHTVYSWKNGWVNRSSDASLGAFKADPENPSAGSDDYPISTTSSGSHTHNLTLTGNTATSAGAETRPVNYGINYIIKI
jgi:microcystin-dependent protein